MCWGDYCAMSVLNFKEAVLVGWVSGHIWQWLPHNSTDNLHMHEQPVFHPHIMTYTHLSYCIFLLLWSVLSLKTFNQHSWVPSKLRWSYHFLQSWNIFHCLRNFQHIAMTYQWQLTPQTKLKSSEFSNGMLGHISDLPSMIIITIQHTDSKKEIATCDPST